jgi:hypothetical protein
MTIEKVFTTLSNGFISAFLTIIDDWNNILDSIRELIFNYELFNANHTAVINAILRARLHVIKTFYENNWTYMNIF